MRWRYSLNYIVVIRRSSWIISYSENWGEVAILLEKNWLYGLGKKSLAERLNATEEEAEDIIQGLYKSFPKLREYVASQQQYPLTHDGYINTMLGDKLQVQEWKYYQAATNQREKKNQEARIQRLGVNLPINNLWPYRETYKCRRLWT